LVKEGNILKRLVVMNADNGKVVASLPLGIGTDGTAYDPGTGDVFVTCRDSGDGKSGATYVFHEDSPDKYSRIAEVKTIYGARTIGLDPRTHHILSIGTEKTILCHPRRTIRIRAQARAWHVHPG